jgi:tetratricopeptide (TPR) repeat protein
VLWISLQVAAQTNPAPVAIEQQVRQLAANQRWDEIVALLHPRQSRSADLNYYYGVALAHLERWKQAQAAFEDGSRLAPEDPRFPLELAGVAFKQRQYTISVRRLRQALCLDPGDSYANDFLGTVYFLQGNLEAALKYWNRVDKPRVAQVQTDPEPKVDPALLDRAFAFSPAATLTSWEFLDSGARVRGLGIFPRFQFDLRARPDEKFDLVFRNQERDGFGSNKWEALFLLFRGLPFLSIYPEYYNFHHEAINFVSLLRADPQKRRVVAEMSGPFERSAKYRYQVVADLRNENWNILTSFTGPAKLLGGLNLRREAVGFNITSETGRVQWSAGAELSHRDFRSVLPGAVLTPELLAEGYQLKQSTQLNFSLWRVPERRFFVDAGGSAQVARLWAQPRESFEKLQGRLEWHWFPQANGDDYEMRQQFRAGGTFGSLPFDELFVLGLERDNDLPVRAHIGTRDGRKGSAPLGRNYFLSSWETDKNLYSNGLATVKLGPFLDTGRITDPVSGLGSNKWLWDVGAQVKLVVFGTGLVFTYGKDLRQGNNAFYLSLLKQ